MKKLSLLLFVSLIFACGNSNIEDIDFSKINEPCDVIDTFELLIDRAYEIQQHYDRNNDEVLYKLEIERVQNKMSDLEKFVEKIDWELEDYKNCSNFKEVNRILESE